MHVGSLAYDGQHPAVLFFDVDGTLVWRDVKAAERGEDVPRFDQLVPSRAVYEAFRRLGTNGHITCICTGRSFCQIPQALLDLNPRGWIVEAGSYVSIGDTVIRDVRIEDSLLFATVSEFTRLGIDAEFESNETLIGFYPTRTLPRFPDYPVTHSVEEFMDMAHEYALAKFCVHDYSQSRLSDMTSDVKEHFDMCDLTHDVMEFSVRGSNKGSAIRSVLRYLRRYKAGTFAFGDSENDLSMSYEVESFIALGNALDSVKRRASFITLPVWEDGVPYALEKMGLI